MERSLVTGKVHAISSTGKYSRGGGRISVCLSHSLWRTLITLCFCNNSSPLYIPAVQLCSRAAEVIFIQVNYRISLNRSRTLINSRPRIGRLVAVLLNLLTRAPRIGRAHPPIVQTWPHLHIFLSKFWCRIATCLYSIFFLSYLMFS